MNNLEEWSETHFEIVYSIVLRRETGRMTGKGLAVYEEHGIGGLYHLAYELSNKFNELYVDADWGGENGPEWFDTIDKFIYENLWKE